MKLYEMLHFMGDEYSSVFMAIRTVTSKPADYFLDRQLAIEEILAMEYPEMRGQTDHFDLKPYKLLIIIEIAQ